MLTVSSFNGQNNLELFDHKQTHRITWSEYNHKVLTLYLNNVKSNWNSDFMICPAPDDLIVGNSFYRSSKETMGILMVSPEGQIAKNISIVKNNLKGNASLIGLNAKKLELIKNKLNLSHPEIEIKSVPLFEEYEEPLLPDEIFNRMDLKALKVNDLKEISKTQLEHFANFIFDKLQNNQEISLSKTDLLSLLTTLPNNKPVKRKLPVVADLSFDDLGKKIITLALKIIQSGYEPDISLYIGSGGNYVGKVLSKLLGTIDASIMASSYDDNGVRGKLRLASNLSIASPDGLKGKILVVDDLVDSGETLKGIGEWVGNKKGVDVVKTAVILKKSKTTVNPDYYAESSDERWAYFPDEIFERLNLKIIKTEDLAKFSENGISKLAKRILENQLIDPRIKISDQTIKNLLLKVS